MSEPARLAAYVEQERPRILDELVAYLRIPSVSSRPDHAGHVAASADMTAELARAAGFEEVAVLETGGHPAAFAQWCQAPGRPTVLVYGHHDVQPVDPEDAWESPPFEPTFFDGQCRARGAIDDKGQVLYNIEAARGLLGVEGALPVNLKLLVEGEEEVGSPHLEQLLASHRELLSADVVVVSDTGMWSEQVPTTCVGMRGLVAFELTLATAEADLHSGTFGGAVPSPVHLLARLVACLHDQAGRVALPGFYDRVAAPSPAELSAVAALPFDEEAWRAMAGARWLEGEEGYSTLERIWFRPTCEVVALSSGYTGEGIKTVVPAAASAKVTFRLVPDQRPEEVAEAFRDWLADRVPPAATCQVRQLGSVAPALTPPDHPAVAAVGRAIERVWGRAPLTTREGGSGPEEALGRVLGAPVVFLGVGLPDDRIHAPNERMVMSQFWKGLLAAAELWHELAAGRPGPAG
jgi:acetylornithine deacetylase/succinyl-diaminopimelate desuccinylase-like protein